MIFSLQNNFSGAGDTVIQSERHFSRDATSRSPDIFPSTRTGAVSGSTGSTSSLLDGVTLMDAREPDRLTASSAVPVSRAKISPPHRNVVSTRAGVVFEIDAGTFNFYAWTPSPSGGGDCSDRFGVRLARWQLLIALDVSTEFCPAFDLVACDGTSPRGNDGAAFVVRSVLQIAQPELWRLERRAWNSNAIRGALELCGQPVQKILPSKQKTAAARFFARFWPPASLLPGHVSHDRCRARAVAALAHACQNGRRDPREHFIALDCALARIAGCVRYVNCQPVESPSGSDRWIPCERFAAQNIFPPVKIAR